MLNRKLINIESICASRTDIQSQVLVTIEMIIEPSEVRFVLLRMKNIIEVLQVEACLLKDAWYQKVALYTIEKEGYNSELYSKLQKYGAVTMGYYRDEIIIQKTGSDEDILHLYNELDGKHLKHFSKSAALSLKPLEGDQSSVISMAA
jgi:acetolactate synthase-1/3 small subunit